MTPGLQIGKFRVGEAYYQCYVNNGTAIINTWTFVGFVKSCCNSTSCDVPHHFYEFRLRQGDGSFDTKHTIRVPSLNGAESSFLTWEQVCVEFDKAKVQVKNP
jgi:hypothetical protein